MRISDWSSDVCSSDLGLRQPFEQFRQQPQQERRVQPRLLIQHVGSEHIDDAAATEIDAHEVVEIERRLAEEMLGAIGFERSEEHTSELQSLMRISYAVFCLKKKNKQTLLK